MAQNENGKVAKAGLAYTIGNYFIKGIGIITVPLFARLMTTNDFGIYNTFLAYESILYIFISLTLHGSLKSATYKFNKDFDNYVSSVQLLPIIVFGVMLLISLIFGEKISILLGIDKISLFLVIIYSYCSGTMIFYRGRIALDYNYTEYLKLSLFNVIFGVLLSVALMLTAFSEQRYLGRIIGGTVAYIILAAYVLIKLFSKASPKYNETFWKYGLKISLPLIPHGLSQILLLQFDRIMISRYVGNSEAGLYSFAYTIYSLVQITGASLETVFSPWVFKTLHEENDVGKVRKIGSCFVMLIAGVVITIMLLCPEVIIVLGGEKYSESVYSAIPVMVAGFFAMAYCVPAVMEYYYEKTSYIAVGTSIAAVLNIVLNYISIRRYGYIAAAYTTLVSYVLYFGLHVYISKKLSKFAMIKLKVFIPTTLLIIIAFIISLKYTDFIIVRIISLIGILGIGSFMLIQEYGKTAALQMLKKVFIRRR